MKYFNIPNTLFIKNREKLRKLLKPNSLVILNSNDEMPRNGDQNFIFRQNSDIFYLTGIDQESSILTICPDHPNPKLREVLFLKETSEKIAVWEGYKYTKEHAREISGITTVFWNNDFEAKLFDLMINSENVYLNLNENIRFATSVPYKDLRFAKEMRKKYPLHTYQRLAPLLTKLRVQKEPEEIEQMQTAVNIAEKTFRRMLKFIKPGVMEYEVEAEIMHEFIRNRANGNSFYPIVASGKNACTLHYIENNDKCKDGDLVLLDFGCEYANYPSDCSRTVPINGKFTARQREVYEAVLRVMKFAKNLLRPGITINIYHEKVCKEMEKELVKLNLITQEEVDKYYKEHKENDETQPPYFKYYMHGTSHFMGIDVHDVGSKDQEILPGMMFSCEPGIYIPEEGIAIRLENDILITENEPIDLMKNIPIEPDEIENLMKK